MKSFQKHRPIRSMAYLKWIRTLPCCQCGGKSVAHHCIGFGDGKMGGTSDDFFCVPLCLKCHADLHNDFGWHKEMILAAQLKWLHNTINRAFSECAIVFVP